MPTPAVRLAVVNDYELVVRGLHEMLRPYAGRVRVVELDADHEVDQPVDVALYDSFAMDTRQAGELSTMMDNPNIAALAVYSWNLVPAYIDDALTRGVRGVLSKALGAAELVDAIERIHAGQIVRSGAGETEPQHGDWPGKDLGLTAREAEVIALITQGLSNQQIAARLYLSINSVKSYIRTAYRTMGVSSRSQAVLWGVQHGFIQGPRRIVVAAE
ncbi:response regulator transcription factor [Calidifontibacter sp. DB0510]|uniref:Response regulator transcription factor n=1 Tax=Metallococcus carri TaxID=1656884 RepID=A0A967EG64_9MICO|nr:response regulator transcription factor [Metallococcus carri]NHN57271.1 response regulator transcription factor [Metallococcus carri]NOP38124.1 response regulator transcription factor [Calidifontibacter sp. DB2511S]